MGGVDKERCYMLIKGTVEQEDIAIRNIYAPNNTASKYTKEKLKKKLQRKMNKLSLKLLTTSFRN